MVFRPEVKEWYGGGAPSGHFLTSEFLNPPLRARCKCSNINISSLRMGSNKNREKLNLSRNNGGRWEGKENNINVIWGKWKGKGKMRRGKKKISPNS